MAIHPPYVPLSAGPLSRFSPPQPDQERLLRERLLVREAQLSQAQRMAGMASWEWYFTSTDILWSPEMYRFWGYEPGEVTVSLEQVARTTHPDDLSILQTAVDQLLQGQDVEMEYRRYDRHGQEIFIYSQGQVVRNDAGEAIGVFGIDMDITKRKRQEQHLLELNRTLAEKNGELERHVAEANAFTYIASHDLQEPLRKIKNFNELILEHEADALSERGRDFFQTVGGGSRTYAATDSRPDCLFADQRGRTHV